MGLPRYVAKFDAGAYLAWENAQPTKHEFLAGEVFAMVGSTDAHNMIAGSVYALTKAHVHGGPCRVFISDMTVRVEAADAYFYPDVVVTCDSRDHEHRTEKRHPKLIVEVLSESTGEFDRGEKFAVYRKIPELEEYVLIDPELQTVDIFQRVSATEWRLLETRGASQIRLASIDLVIPLTDLFENVPRRSPSASPAA